MTDKRLAGAKRVAVDTFGWRFQRPATATSGMQFLDHWSDSNSLRRPIVSQFRKPILAHPEASLSDPRNVLVGGEPVPQEGGRFGGRIDSPIHDDAAGDRRVSRHTVGRHHADRSRGTERLHGERTNAGILRTPIHPFGELCRKPMGYTASSYGTHDGTSLVAQGFRIVDGLVVEPHRGRVQPHT